jgi:TonB family protein
VPPTTPPAAAPPPAPSEPAHAASPAHRTDAPPVHLASAAPAAAVLRAPAASALVPIARESPTFPREAIALGLAHGDVKAELTIDAKGNVSDVAVVDASHRAFNRAVREALVHWRFPAGAPGRTTTVDITFKRD